MTSFLQYKKNVFSQNGEDGIIEEIFKILNIKNGLFIEFGAWDGKFLSNSYKLFEEGWGGIFIEADNNKYRELTHNFAKYERIQCINKYVGFTEDDSLDNIIDNSKFSNNMFDFVSIDVDGLDYFIFEKINKHLPKVICIEVSSGHAPDFSEIIPASIAYNNVGQSITVMSNTAAEKGYFPLCYTGNLFFIKNEYKHLFEPYIKSVVDIYLDFLENIVEPDRDLMIYLQRLFCQEDGRTDRLKAMFGYVFNNNPYLASFLSKRLH